MHEITEGEQKAGQKWRADWKGSAEEQSSVGSGGPLTPRLDSSRGIT